MWFTNFDFFHIKFRQWLSDQVRKNTKDAIHSFKGATENLDKGLDIILKLTRVGFQHWTIAFKQELFKTNDLFHGIHTSDFFMLNNYDLIKYFETTIKEWVHDGVSLKSKKFKVDDFKYFEYDNFYGCQYLMKVIRYFINEVFVPIQMNLSIIQDLYLRDYVNLLRTKGLSPKLVELIFYYHQRKNELTCQSITHVVRHRDMPESHVHLKCCGLECNWENKEKGTPPIDYKEKDASKLKNNAKVLPLMSLYTNGFYELSIIDKQLSHLFMMDKDEFQFKVEQIFRKKWQPKEWYVPLQNEHCRFDNPIFIKQIVSEYLWILHRLMIVNYIYKLAFNRKEVLDVHGHPIACVIQLTVKQHIFFVQATYIFFTSNIYFCYKIHIFFLQATYIFLDKIHLFFLQDIYIFSTCIF